jgi:putative membrane protein
VNILQMELLAAHEVHGWDEWVLWPLLGLLLVAGAVVSCVWLMVRPPGPLGARTARDRAVDILTERFARGELSAEEYRERLSELESSAVRGSR